MDAVLSLIFLSAFVIGIIALRFLVSGNSMGGWKKGVGISPWDLRTFLHLENRRHKPNKAFLFSEELVISMGHRFKGRFDQAIIRWDEVPILELLIERKFPVRIIPDKAKSEDVFQAGLYALALMEQGVSCSSTKLAIIYCLQKNAKECVNAGIPANCLKCKKGRIFKEKFRPKKIIRAIGKLNQMWYQGRKPRPNPETSKCIACPYRERHLCNYSAV